MRNFFSMVDPERLRQSPFVAAAAAVELAAKPNSRAAAALLQSKPSTAHRIPRSYVGPASLAARSHRLHP